MGVAFSVIPDLYQMDNIKYKDTQDTCRRLVLVGAYIYIYEQHPVSILSQFHVLLLCRIGRCLADLIF